MAISLAADIAFADQLKRYYGRDFIHVPGIGFYVWDGRRFRPDATATVMAAAEQTVSRLQQEALMERNKDEAERLTKLAAQYSHTRNVRGALEFFKPHIAVRPDEPDSDRYALNVLNGTVDLRTCELREHNRQDRITKLVPIKYDAEAPAPRWYQFLTEIFAGDIKLTEYLKRVVGYSLTGSQRDHIIVFLWGTGSNGKSTLVAILMAQGGDYAQAAPASMMIKKPYGDAVPADVARLRGTHLVIASEVSGRRPLRRGADQGTYR